MLSASHRSELADFIGNSVLPGTMRVYNSHWELWRHFLEVHGGIEDGYQRGVADADKAALISLFMYRRYQEGARGKTATSVTAGIRMHFVQQLEPSTFLNSAVIATARKACRMNTEELRVKHESEAADTVKLPISEDVLEAMRARLWDHASWEGAGLNTRMAYIGCMWAFDQTARISEYTTPEPGNQDHCVRVDDLTFILNVGDSVRGSGLFQLLAGDTPEGAVKLDDILECHVQAVMTQGKNDVKAKLISRSSAEESRFLDDVITFIVKAGSYGADELFSYRRQGGEKVALRARTVRDELKRECVAQGLPPNFFSSHSFRKGGVTHMRAAGASEDDRRDRTGHAPGSQLINTTYDFAPGRGPLAANSLVGGRRPTIIDVKKLIPVKRTAGKGVKRTTASAAEKPIASKRARKGAAKPTRPSVVVGRGSRDPESIWSAPELELVRSKGRRVSEDQL